MIKLLAVVLLVIVTFTNACQLHLFWIDTVLDLEMKTVIFVKHESKEEKKLAHHTVDFHEVYGLKKGQDQMWSSKHNT